KGPLKLHIAEDVSTRTALTHVASRFWLRPIEELQSKHWDANQLNALLAPDLAADMLQWMNGDFSEAQDSSIFAAFAGIAERELKFDPIKSSRQDAANRLAKKQGNWANVWHRFEVSNGYANVVALLNAEEPNDLLADKSSYPRVN